jgi:hypothetical protein
VRKYAKEGVWAQLDVERTKAGTFALLQLNRAFTPLQPAKTKTRKPYFHAPAPISPDARHRVAWNATLGRQNVRTIVRARARRCWCYTAVIDSIAYGLVAVL